LQTKIRGILICSKGPEEQVRNQQAKAKTQFPQSVFDSVFSLDHPYSGFLVMERTVKATAIHII